MQKRQFLAMYNEYFFPHVARGFIQTYEKCMNVCTRRVAWNTSLRNIYIRGVTNTYANCLCVTFADFLWIDERPTWHWDVIIEWHNSIIVGIYYRWIESLMNFSKRQSWKSQKWLSVKLCLSNKDMSLNLLYVFYG